MSDECEDDGFPENTALCCSDCIAIRQSNVSSNTFLMLKQGAEARVYSTIYFGRPAIVKERFVKQYRHPDLDARLRTDRLKAEVRSMVRCVQIGVRTPTLYFIDQEHSRLVMEFVRNAVTVRDFINEIIYCDMTSSDVNYREQLFKMLGGLVGETIGQIHSAGIIHGDLTTSNMLITNPGIPLFSQETVNSKSFLKNIKGRIENLRITMIDFGLSSMSGLNEDKAVDLYVLERAILSTHPDCELLIKCILDAYADSFKKGANSILKRLDEVRLRGRKREMIG